MRMKKYAEAIAAYVKCRDLYRAQAGKQFTNTQDAQRYRQDRLTEIDEQIRTDSDRAADPAPRRTACASCRIRSARFRTTSRAGDNVSIENSVPAFVSLALGSAYFRTEQCADAEREYKAAIAADPKSGEALQQPRGRVPADRPLQGGRRVRSSRRRRPGYKVHPQLKQDIKAKLTG